MAGTVWPDKNGSKGNSWMVVTAAALYRPTHMLFTRIRRKRRHAAVEKTCGIEDVRYDGVNWLNRAIIAQNYDFKQAYLVQQEVRLQDEKRSGAQCGNAGAGDLRIFGGFDAGYAH